MTNEQKRERFIELAVQHFGQGLNCAECVFRAYLDMEDTELPSELVAISSGFGGGMGRTLANTCGALAGGAMALGAAKGRKNPFEMEDAKARSAQLGESIYPMFAELSNEFSAVYGTTICGQMVKDFEDFGGIERKRFCKQAVITAATAAAKRIYD